ncbi:MAG: MBL fold metallo-hydrolase [Myxococcales bacterium]|nr:MBL fold metallo-hydrolase [Myxococcales bacterium]
MKRRTWLAGGLALGGAGLLEYLSLRGDFDNRSAVGTTNGDRYRQSIRRLDAGEVKNGLLHLAHSTHLIVLDGKRILTDPWFFDPAFGSLDHAVLPPVQAEKVGKLDAILVSHDHPDHADPMALDRLDKSATVFVGLKELETKLRLLGFKTVVRIGEWEQGKLGDLEIAATPALHDSPEVGFVLSGEQTSVYFGGDTTLIDDHHRIGEQFAPIVSILPVDGTRIRWEPLLVMDPTLAVEATRRLKSRQVFPSHHEAGYSDPLAEHLLSTTVRGAGADFSARVEEQLSGVKAEQPQAGELVPLILRG